MSRDYVVAVDTRTGKAVDAWPGNTSRPYPGEVHLYRMSSCSSKGNAIKRAELHWRELQDKQPTSERVGRFMRPR